MTVHVLRPRTSSGLSPITAALTNFVNHNDLSLKRDIIIYAFDQSESNWEEMPAAWYRPNTGDIVINMGLFYRESQKLIMRSSGGYLETVKSRSTGDKFFAVRTNTPMIDSIAREIDRYWSTSRHSFTSAAHGTVRQTHLKLNALLNSMDLPGARDSSAVPRLIATRLIGIILHETGHSVYSNFSMEPWWAELDHYPRQILTMFDELRCERQQIKRIGGGARFIRHAADLVVNPSQICDDITASKDSDGRTSVASLALNATLTLGRGSYGVFRAFELRSLRESMVTVVGEDRMSRMEEMWEEFSSSQDLTKSYARSITDRWIEMFPYDSNVTSNIAVVIIVRNKDGGAQDSIPTSAPDGNTQYVVLDVTGEYGQDDPDVEAPETIMLPGVTQEIDETTRDAAESAEENLTYDEEEYGPNDLVPSRVSYQKAIKASTKIKRIPAPPSDFAYAKKLALELEQLSLTGRYKHVVRDVVPPGRLHSRAALQRAAERQAGQLPRAKPWKRVKTLVDTSPPLTLGVMTDISSSQGWATEFSSRMSWILVRAVNEINGRVASCTFGAQTYVMNLPGENHNYRLQMAAAEGREQFDRGAGTMDTILNLLGGTGVRILIVVTDGNFVIKGEVKRGQLWVDRLVQSGCGVVWIHPSTSVGRRMGGLPVVPKRATSMSVDKFLVKSDPGQAVNQVASAIKQAIRDARGT